MTSYLTSIDTFFLSRTVFEIFDFKVFGVWPWPLTFRGHLGSKIFSPFESPYMTSYLTSIDTFFLSRTVFRAIRLQSFRVWPWPLTFRGHLRSKNIFTIRKFIHDFLSNFYRHFLSISYRFRDIRLQSFFGLTLTFDLQRSPGVKNILIIRKPIHDFLSNFYRHFLSISYRFWDIRLRSF